MAKKPVARKTIAERNAELLDTKKVQLLLGVYYSRDGQSDRGTYYGKVEMHVGDEPIPALTHDEMQQIAFAAKMEFARLMRYRRKYGKTYKPVL